MYPHLACYYSHNILAIVPSSLLLVVVIVTNLGISNRTFYSFYIDRLSSFHCPCLKNILLVNSFYSYLRYCSSTRVNWKVHKLTKILSWNMTKWGLFFNIVPLAVHTLFSLVLLWSHWSKNVINNKYDILLWTFQPTLISVPLNQSIWPLYALSVTGIELTTAR